MDRLTHPLYTLTKPRVKVSINEAELGKQRKRTPCTEILPNFKIILSCSCTTLGYSQSGKEWDEHPTIHLTPLLLFQSALSPGGRTFLLLVGRSEKDSFSLMASSFKHTVLHCYHNYLRLQVENMMHLFSGFHLTVSFWMTLFFFLEWVMLLLQAKRTEVKPRVDILNYYFVTHSLLLAFLAEYVPIIHLTVHIPTHIPHTCVHVCGRAGQF